ncbi:MAG: hypothetical protein ACTSU2_03005 [Promethearchaeota archaeon]
MIEAGYYLKIDFYLWIIVLLTNFFFMYKMIIRFKNPETELFGKYFKGVFSFFLIHGISRIFYFVYDYFVIDQHIFYEIGVLFGILSITAFIYYIESTIFTKSKHGLFIFGVIGSIVSLSSIIFSLLGQDTVILSEYTQYFTVPILGIVIPLIYLYTAIITTGRVRANSIIIMFGIIVFILGQMAHTPTAVQLLGDFLKIASPVLMLVGILIFYYGLVRGNE